MIKKLKDICSTVSRCLLLNKLERNNGPYPLFGAKGIMKYIDFYDYENDYLSVIKWGAGVGRITRHPGHSSILGTMQGLMPKEGIDIDWFYYCLCSMHLERHASVTTVPNLYFKDYGENLVNVPSLQEQKAISEYLSKISNCIDKCKKQLILLDEIIMSKFYEMFGDPELNSNNYLQKPFDELGLLARGKSKHRPRNDPKLLGGPYPLIQTGDVANADLFIKKYSSTYSEFGLQQSKIWPKGTLCITIAANIAESAILTFDACFPDSVVGFTPNKEVNIFFIKYQLEALKRYLDSQATAVAQKNLNLEKLSSALFIIPPKTDQESFAIFVKKVYGTKDCIEKRITSLIELLDKKMDELFGGNK